MTPQTMEDAGNPNSVRSERVQDLLMISSFGFWAVLLGVMPVLAFYTLMGD